MNVATEKAANSPSPINSGSERATTPVAATVRHAFEAACVEHLDQVWRQLRAMGVAAYYLDDATQEVFLTAHHKLDSFEGRAQFGTWLYAIAYRVGCNYRRKTKRTNDELLEQNHPSRERNPEQSLSDKRAAELVERFCAQLSEKLRDVFVLCLLEGQPVVEVAPLLGVSVNTAHSRLRLVREAFRKELARLEEPLI